MSSDSTQTERWSIETQLSTEYSNMGYWQRSAAAAEDDAAEMRRVARGLDREIAPLRTVFGPIRSLHVAATWEGQAATLSRQRLDEHELRCTTAIRTVDALVDDLDAEALRAEARADTARSFYNTARRSAVQLEIELGRLDDVYI